MDEPFTITLATRAVILALAAVGLNIALGLGGLVSLGHAVFFGLGRLCHGHPCLSRADLYTRLELGPLTIEGTKSMPVIWLVAVVVSALAAWVIGVLSLRTSGVYFIMITLAFGQMFFYFAISWSTYGGEDGLVDLRPKRVSRVEHAGSDPVLCFCFVTILCVVLFAMSRLMASPFGLALNAARQVPGRVETVGLNAHAAEAGGLRPVGRDHRAGGGLVCRPQPFRQPDDVFLAVLGRDHHLRDPGRCCASVAGRFWALSSFVVLEHWLGGLTAFWHIYLGVILLGIVLFARGGLIGILTGKGAAHG